LAFDEPVTQLDASMLGAGTGSLVATAMSGHIALLRRPVDHSFGEQDDA
jgi:hypothetical protein